MKQKYLFICGCPRSGTTALVRLLNSHPALAVGMERYKYYASKKKISKINKSSFEFNSFFDLKDNQTNINWKYFYDELEPKYKLGVTYLGDKYPHYYRFYHRLNHNLGNVRWIFIVRDIASIARSYNSRAADPEDSWSADADFTKAVEHWNESLTETWKYQKSNPSPKLFVCEYERLFAYDLDYLNSLFAFLELEQDERVVSFFEGMKQDWLDKKAQKSSSSVNLSQTELDYINEHANFGLKENLIKRFSVPHKVRVS
ncbi:MAG: sulfotransferase [Cyanobacteria bacterium J06623_7]